MEGYKDSRAKLTVYQTKRINTAKASAVEGNYEDAYKILEPMEDSAEAVRVLTDIKNQEKYALAMAAIEADQYNISVDLLTELGYYKDSQNQLQKYRTSRITSAKKFASDGAYQTAYSILDEMEDYTEAVNVNITLHKDEQFDKAKDLIAAEDYVSAKEILVELGTHKNSNSELYTMRTKCRTSAIEKIKSEDYSFAVNNIEALDNMNIISLLNGITTDEAKILILKLNEAQKLDPIFTGMDIAGKQRILTLMGNGNAASYLASLPAEDVIALFKSTAYQTVLTYLASMENASATALLDQMDKTTANYYINGMELTRSIELLKSMKPEKQALYFESMTSFLVANIVRDWDETDRIAAFRLMERPKTKDIYALINLPKIITFDKPVYYLKEHGSEIIKALLSDKTFTKDDIEVIKTNNVVVNTSEHKVNSDAEIQISVKALNPGTVYIHFENPYGRVLSDAVAVTVLQNTPVPTAIPKNNTLNTSNTSSHTETFNYSGPTCGGTVYVTPYGSKYHCSKECAGKNARAISIQDAVRQGYGPCGTCAH